MKLEKKTVIIIIIILIVIASCFGSFVLGNSLHTNSDDAQLVILDEGTFNPNEKIYVIGHKNPDLDTVCSAIGLAELLSKMGLDAVPAVCGNLPSEVEYFLKLFNKESPVLLNDVSGKHIFLVDHNVFMQGVEGIDNADIIGIVDHHSFGGSMTNNPLFVLIEPVGSTSTIVTQLYNLYYISIDKATAGILLAAIIDDTQNLTSSTTTYMDRLICNQLLLITGLINTETFYNRIIDMETNYSGMTDKEILNHDCKPYTIEGFSLYISDVKVKGKEEMDKMVRRMKNAMETSYQEMNVNHLYVLVTDRENNKSELLYYGKGSEQVVREAFPVDSSGRIFFDHAAIRKTDIVPQLKNAYKKIIESFITE